MKCFSDFQYEYKWFFGNVISKNETCPICFEEMNYKECSCKNRGFDVGLVHLFLNYLLYNSEARVDIPNINMLINVMDESVNTKPL